MLRLITDIGDAAFLVPMSCLVLAYLLWRHSSRAALAWISALVLCGGLTLLAKIGFYVCGDQLADAAIRSPSGHTSLSATFYGCGALLLSTDRRRPIQLALLLASGALILAIAASRILLDAHTPAEVVVGLIIGFVAVAWFGLHYFRAQTPTLPLLPLAVVMILVAFLVHGRHINTEKWIAAAAQHLRLSGAACAVAERGPARIGADASRAAPGGEQPVIYPRAKRS